MKNRILFFLIILFFNVAVCSDSPSIASATINSNGATDLSDAFGKSHVLIKFTTHEIDIGRPSDERPSKILNSCTYSRYPCSSIDLIEIFVNGVPLFVPRSAYSDLADINGATLRQKQKGEFELSMVGGDASESYTIEITFNNSSVNQRVLIGNEAKKNLQKTTYYAQPTIN